jgi:hypothetical protein
MNDIIERTDEIEREASDRLLASMGVRPDDEHISTTLRETR